MIWIKGDRTQQWSPVINFDFHLQETLWRTKTRCNFRQKIEIMITIKTIALQDSKGPGGTKPVTTQTSMVYIMLVLILLTLTELPGKHGKGTRKRWPRQKWNLGQLFRQSHVVFEDFPYSPSSWYHWSDTRFVQINISILFLIQWHLGLNIKCWLVMIFDISLL